MQRIRVLLCGAAGKMGREIIRAISEAPDLELCGAADLVRVGEDAGLLAGINPLGVTVTDDLAGLIEHSNPVVLVDFTSPQAVKQNIYQALRRRVAVVAGTTGLGESDLHEIEQWVARYSTGAIIAPNFALGAVLLLKAAQLGARYLKAVEIIEMHHDEKLDAPSGTALTAARLIGEAAGAAPPGGQAPDSGAASRGGRASGIPVHSIRLPGAVAHHEIIFGGEGQLLTLRHDALNRRCFIPGLLMAVRRAPENKALIYGMEKLL